MGIFICYDEEVSIEVEVIDIIVARIRFWKGLEEVDGDLVGSFFKYTFIYIFLNIFCIFLIKMF